MASKFSYILFFGLILTGFLCYSQINITEVTNALAKEVDETGASSLILIKDGSIIYEKAFLKDQGQITTATQVRIASAAKWLAAATLLSIVDEGKISLDDPIKKYLSQFKGEKDSITLRQLLSHTSGLPPNSLYIKDRQLSLAQSVDSIAKNINLVSGPGLMFSYGGVSFQVAARLAEVVTGKSWDVLFEEKIARPCQMINTDFGDMQSKNIADGAYSTARDYSNFLLMILNYGVFNNERVLSAQVINEMLTNQIGDLPIGYTPYRFKSVKSTNYYGLGVWIDRIVLSDSIASEVSSQGAKGFTPWINKCKNLVGVYSFYGDLSKIQPVVETTKRIIDESIKSDCLDVETEKKEKLESSFSLEQNYPNPFSSTSNILFKVNEDAEISLKLFDALGNEIEELVNGKLKAGEYTVPVETADLKAGIYFYRLIVDGKSETKKLAVKQ